MTHVFTTLEDFLKLSLEERKQLWEQRWLEKEKSCVDLPRRDKRADELLQVANEILVEAKLTEDWGAALYPLVFTFYDLCNLYRQTVHHKFPHSMQQDNYKETDYTIDYGYLNSCTDAIDWFILDNRNGMEVHFVSHVAWQNMKKHFRICYVEDCCSKTTVLS